MTIGMFLLFGYLIVKKEYYGLLSGFAMKSDEEQQELIKRGYPQAAGKGLTYSGYILVMGLILQLVNVPHAIMLSWVVMLLYLFGYLFYISKYDIEKTKKRNLYILAATMIFTFGIIFWGIYVGVSSNELIVKNDQVHITGMYGVEWPLDEITSVSIVHELPRIQMRTNGFAYGDRLKGNFRIEGLGTGKLYLYRNHLPYVFIQRGEDYVFINSKDKTTTLQWFDDLNESIVQNK